MIQHWIDSHCHLEMTKESIPDLFIKTGLSDVLECCITIGTDHTSNQQVVKMCNAYPQLYGTLGVHPHEASKLTNEHLTFLEQEAANNPDIVAIGECGFDYFYGFSDQKSQREAFEKQLNIAACLNLPVVIHTREAENETMEVLNQYKNANLKGVFHCFTSSERLARFALDLGFYISFNGIATFPKSEDVRTILKLMPSNRILLETDSPYLAPVPHRGKPNTPKHIPVIGQFISEFLDIPVEDFAKLTSDNTKRLFSRISNGN